MSDWQPGDPLYSRDHREHLSVGAVRPMFSLFTELREITPAKAARWPDPLPTHDLDAQEGRL